MQNSTPAGRSSALIGGSCLPIRQLGLQLNTHGRPRGGHVSGEKDLRQVAVNVRANIVGVLRTFASLDEQRAYQVEVPFVNVLGELFCQWEDDLYHPETEAFLLAFMPGERAALRSFDAAIRLAAAPGALPRLAVWLESAAAAELAACAAETLRALRCPEIA